MTTFARERTLSERIAPAVERSLPGVEVLAVELLSPSRFCVYVDHPAGVDHALCERVTSLLEDYRSEYTIDVSSPGPERPLRTPRHFARVAGRQVTVRTEVEVAGRRRFRGTVLEVDDEAVTVASGNGSGPVRIPYGAIVRANLIDEGLTS
ncbi:MAG TPA: ribosome maturation factor RimP [Gaiellaceae bacterium]|nr:ribosome maturation factor RimP [Gaiellaceae bacterium]